MLNMLKGGDTFRLNLLNRIGPIGYLAMQGGGLDVVETPTPRTIWARRALVGWGYDGPEAWAILRYAKIFGAVTVPTPVGADPHLIGCDKITVEYNS